MGPGKLNVVAALARRGASSAALPFVGLLSGLKKISFMDAVLIVYSQVAIFVLLMSLYVQRSNHEFGT